ncbi:cytochrome D1 domain-containing protein [Atopomonas sediminilitoris]|uniref:cytochrome D1 domain-containing protein n=1 Tax=Atopomonas sediminilitoris TaxID=2919919 RepID=UPI001F4E2A3C|nr:cytochrome D1 domain-containing protein [Atopomonas sediminilitoris]MCJ8170843.1 protein nirF [Atopomonas sediminilitoris]
MTAPRRFRPRLLLSAAALSLLSACSHLAEQAVPAQPLLATGDLGVIIERDHSSVQLISQSGMRSLARIEGLGDLSHASLVFSPDQRYAYVFARDGGLSKIDLLEQRLVKRVVQGGNSIGGAISQDGSLIAVSNYEPGGVKVFNSDSLDLVADIPATPLPGQDRNARTVGLVDAPGQRFVFSLFDSDETWLADFSQADASNQYQPQLQRFTGIGKQPYDALLTPDGRYYIAGLFGEDGMAKLDLWHPERGVQRILGDYGRGQEKLPVYKMPHLEGWTVAGEKTFVPAIGQHQVLVLDSQSWQPKGAIDVAGQPVFVMARPDHRQIWVNFAYPDNNKLQIIDSESQQIIATLEPGPAVLHMEFSARGHRVWVSVRDGNEVQVWDTYRLKKLATLPAHSPSGIFFTHRAQQMGL